ncbi:hypothetical protein [Erwinia sp. E_sp_B04_7]|uniref:hypothetical protein n=1 Tax=unclassified Erwinia TaxID=2622719 RepID=UPI0030CE7D9E
MSEFKGTPGPWSYDEPGCKIVALNECEYIADLYNSTPTYNINDANANLISAAPELLEACLRIQAHFRQAGIESKASSFNPVEDSAAQIDAVILKALGQQQL